MHRALPMGLPDPVQAGLAHGLFLVLLQHPVSI